MTYLLDVNVLIALIDPYHAFHDLAHDWFSKEGQANWATCPITENGVIRILGSTRYPKGPETPAAAASFIRGMRELRGHSFWADDLSLLDDAAVRIDRIATAAQVTDTYLLALAARRGGKLATLDRRLSAMAVDGGGEALLAIQ